MESPTANEEFSRGKRLFREKADLDKVLKAFERAYRKETDNPAYMSYYGMCVALRHGEIGTGVDLCTKAIKKDFNNPEFYLNLGRVYLVAGNRKGAITVFKKGLKYDPDHRDLNRMLEELGVRGRPVIPFLRRSNPLNRLLGMLFRRIPEIFKTKRRMNGKRNSDGIV